VKVDPDHLQKLARPSQQVAAVAELIWNALDADASNVFVEFQRNELDGIETIYLLPLAGAVARVARSMSHWDDAVKEVGVARWLAGCGVPAGVALDVAQPVEAGGHPVPFWRFIEGRPGRREDVGALGEVLRRLHALPAPATFALPAEDIMGRVRPRVAASPIDPADRVFLLDRCDEL
jgi:hypothetical protein